MPVFAQVAIRLNADDNVAIAKQEIAAGTLLDMPKGESLLILDTIPAGHKFALESIAEKSPVRRYGYPIGKATWPIFAGRWAHTHNLATDDVRQAYAYNVVDAWVPEPSSRTLMGYRRADGRVGTRNYVAVIATVNCAAKTATAIARAFSAERLAAFPNVDGVVAITHGGGCSFTPDGLTHAYLKRSLAGIARNPNIGGFLFVGLGCEGNQIDAYCERDQTNPNLAGRLFPASGSGIVIQDQGGMRKTISAGVQAIESLLPQVNACERAPQPISELTVALQCGGSDSWSGVTANPLLGRAMDRLIQQGGTAVLSETPEIFGAEHLLTARVTSAAVGEKLIERFTWWSEQSAQLGFHVDNNPTPGNKQGGLTTIFEKSLGAVAKGGSSPLIAVYQYAEPITSRGLVFMDTPGNDVISVTGQLAGGCNLVIFTTGRGSVLGGSAAPCIKIASNSALSARMGDDMDYAAGKILEGISMDDATDQLLDLIVAVASGKHTKSEEGGPETEFEPWQVGTAV
jgi:altronate hydrolase